MVFVGLLKLTQCKNGRNALAEVWRIEYGLPKVVGVFLTAKEDDVRGFAEETVGECDLDWSLSSKTACTGVLIEVVQVLIKPNIKVYLIINNFLNSISCKYLSVERSETVGYLYNSLFLYF